MVKNLISVRIKKKDATNLARQFNKNFKQRGLKRRVNVRPIGKTILKKLLTPKSFKETKEKRRFGIFIKK